MLTVIDLVISKTVVCAPDVCTASSFDLKHANYALLSSNASNINRPQLFMAVSPDNFEGIWPIFKSIVLGSIKTFVPLRHVVNNSSPHQYST